MLEIELKYANVDHTALAKKLGEWGVTNFEEHLEEDQYLNAPDRDFAITGEALRLRRVGESACLTYKGQKLPGEVKTRPELELPLPPGEQMRTDYLQLFVHLGYRPVAVVRKRRRQASTTRMDMTMQICLDSVEELGDFAELEILAEPERRTQAESVLFDMAASLGLAQVEKRSYLTMLLLKREGRL